MPDIKIETPVTEELRQAAAVLRETAAKATPGPWLHHATIGERSEDGHTYTITRPYCGNQTLEPCSPACGADVLTTGLEGCEEDNLTEADAAWIALANPLLAEPLAAWLEEVADEAAAHEAQGMGNSADEIAEVWPLAVARALNGGPR